MSFDVIANGWRKLLKNGGVGYTESGKVILNVALEQENAEDIDLVASVGLVYSDVPTIEAGKRYLVTTDSGTAECVAKQILDETVCIGNFAPLGGEDTGESFLCYCMFDIDNYKSEVVDFNNGTHMTVAEAETVHTIDPKYLPVIELTAEPTADGVVLSEAESAEVAALFASKSKIAIVCYPNTTGIFSPLIFRRMESDGVVSYAANHPLQAGAYIGIGVIDENGNYGTVLM